MSVDIAISLLASTDGRDKLYKTMENISKLLACFAQQRCSSKLVRFSQRISDGRSLMRIGKWVTNAQKLADSADKNVAEQTLEENLDKSRIFCDLCYIILDNILYFNRFLLMSLKQEASYVKKSKVFQFWTFFFACALDIVKIIRKYKANGNVIETKDALNFVKNFADFLVTLSAVKYLSIIYKPSAAWLSMCSIVSGSIATAQHVKLLQALSKD